MKKILSTAAIFVIAVSMTGCVKVSRVKQAAAADACRIHGGRVQYNLVSTTCILPSGRAFTTY